MASQQFVAKVQGVQVTAEDNPRRALKGMLDFMHDHKGGAGHPPLVGKVTFDGVTGELPVADVIFYYPPE